MSFDEQYLARFDGIRRLYGDAGARIVRDMHVCVVGIGGVGSWAVEALARSGVAKITMIDHDDICVSNVNRQVHALDDGIGRGKIDVMAERVRAINPVCEVNCIDDFLRVDNMREYLERGYDYVIDAIDGITVKAATIYHCKRNKIPVIATGGAGGLTDPGMIKIADLSRTYNDPLAAKVRACLRERHNFSKNTKRRFGVECVFSSQQQLYPKPDGSVSHEKPGVHGLSLDCAMGYGASMCVTTSFGMLAVSRVIDKVITRRMR